MSITDRELFSRQVPGADEPVIVAAYSRVWSISSHTHPEKVNFNRIALKAGTCHDARTGHDTDEVIPAELSIEDYPTFRRNLLAALDEAAHAAGWQPEPESDQPAG